MKNLLVGLNSKGRSAIAEEVPIVTAPVPDIPGLAVANVRQLEPGDFVVMPGVDHAYAAGPEGCRLLVVEIGTPPPGSARVG
jgi:hypothetical protein